MRLNREVREATKKLCHKKNRRFWFGQSKSLTNKNHNRKEVQLKAFPTEIMQHILNTQVFKLNIAEVQRNT